MLPWLLDLCEEQPLPNGSISARARDNTMNRQMCDLVPVLVVVTDLAHFMFNEVLFMDCDVLVCQKVVSAPIVALSLGRHLFENIECESAIRRHGGGGRY
jgi:hypothetical protein